MKKSHQLKSSSISAFSICDLKKNKKLKAVFFSVFMNKTLKEQKFLLK